MECDAVVMVVFVKCEYIVKSLVLLVKMSGKYSLSIDEEHIQELKSAEVRNPEGK